MSSPIPLTTENTESTEEVTEKKNSVDAHVIGETQLEGAINHYNQGNYICAITLARAAEECLGRLLKHTDNNKQTALENLTHILSELYPNKWDLNAISNELKHFNPDFCGRSIDLKSDAIQLIDRATRNLINLNLKPTDLITSFANSHNTYTLNQTTYKKTQNHLNHNPIPPPVSFSVNSVSSVVKNTNEDLNIISGKIINCAITVHKQLGAGLLESAYQHGMAYALAKEGLKFEKEKLISIIIDNHKLDAGYRADFIVEENIILEIKAVENLAKNHDAQILNYMRLGKFSLGLLMNFNETLLKNGLKRFKI